MKLLKAYVRTYMAGKVIESLKERGCPRLTAIEVKGVGDEINPEHLKMSAEYGSSYTNMTKLEFVCADDCIDEAVEVILEHAKTGYKGDGIIIISSVDDVIRIRTGERGESAH